MEELYRCCEAAREILQGEHGVGRVIARPFVGEYPNFTRTANRHDYSLVPPTPNLCSLLQKEGLDTIGVGKIYDIFAGQNISVTYKTQNNTEGMERALELAASHFQGLAFVNLVDFDMVYGHRNDVVGYTNALNLFDCQLGSLMAELREGDLLLLTADHGCDPSTSSTDHSREYVPLLAWGSMVKPGVDLGIRDSFSDISATILEAFALQERTPGTSFLGQLLS